MGRRFLLVGLAGGLVLAAANDALARREHSFGYPYVRVWEAAVRLVRVDFESPISERNREDGYFLFDFAHEGEVHPGSVEVVRAPDEQVRVVIQVPGLPSYVEQMMLDRLAKKLEAEYGAPPERPKADPGEKKPEGGAKPSPKAGHAPAAKGGKRPGNPSGN